MSNSPSHNINPAPGQDLPWYRQFWPWFIIALPASVVVASFITLWLAISNPDPLVIKVDYYQRFNSEIKAQAAELVYEQSDSDGTTPRSN
jgi:hypothetical protein